MSKAFTEADRHRLVAGAARAPSAHNAQPARWCFTVDGHIHLLEDRCRVLPVADPGGWDHRLGLGAACEAMTIVASRLGYELSAPELEKPAPAAGRYHLVARLRLAGQRSVDPDAHLIDARATFRGLFAPLTDKRKFKLQAAVGGRAGLHLVIDRQRIGDLSHLHDECSMDFLRRPEFIAELYSWLRLSRRHPDWGRDGFNGDALQLSATERAGASGFMRPKVVRVADACGLAAKLMSEERVSRSAGAMLVMLAGAYEDRFETGRRFYRLWLEITRLGLSACPMSALVDHPRGKRALGTLVGLGEEQVLVNVFRIGMAASPIAPTPRLPVEELIIDARRLDQLQEFQ